MGYTHYWRQPTAIPADRWTEIVKDVSTILRATNIPLAFEYDEPQKQPQCDAECIQFNGVGDDGHETFVIGPQAPGAPRYQGDDPSFAFCKTAAKPYDAVVCAVLAYLDSRHGKFFIVSSDGDEADWSNGVELANRALGIRAPREVRRDEEEAA